MEVWSENDDNDERPRWVIVFLLLLGVVFLGLVIWGGTAALASIIPG
jgi:hypothetical protein